MELAPTGSPAPEGTAIDLVDVLLYKPDLTTLSAFQVRATMSSTADAATTGVASCLDGKPRTSCRSLASPTGDARPRLVIGYNCMCVLAWPACVGVLA